MSCLPWIIHLFAFVLINTHLILSSTLNCQIKELKETSHPITTSTTVDHVSISSRSSFLIVSNRTKISLRTDYVMLIRFIPSTFTCAFDRA